VSRSQRELKALRQQQREEAQRKQRATERRNLIVIAAGVAVVGVVIFITAQLLQHSATGGQQHLTFQAQSGTAGIQIPDEGTPTHIDPSTTWNYKFYPPTSGPHYSVPGSAPAAWQTVDQPLVEGQFVHNLEHGGIVILYNCPSGCSQLVGQLKNYVQNLAPPDPEFNEYKILMTPYSRGMTHKVALIAWHWIEWLDGYDQAAITRFYEIHVDQGPEHIQ
jgi:hypothetical protein